MDAQTLFKQGIAAIRECQDTALGQRYLLQSLRLDPANEMAWLWLSHTYDDPKKQIACLDRALRLNPHNERALARKQTVLAHMPAEPVKVTPAPIYTPQGHGISDNVFAPSDDDPFAPATSSAAPGPALSVEERRDYKRLFLSRGSKAAIAVEETLHRRGFDWKMAHSLTLTLAREATYEAERKNGLTHLIMGSTVVVVAVVMSLLSIKVFEALGGSGYVVWIGLFLSGCADAGYGIKLLYQSMAD